VSVEIAFGFTFFRLKNCSMAWGASAIAVVGTTAVQAISPVSVEIPNNAAAVSLMLVLGQFLSALKV
jgi:hypothetical protein